MNKLIRGDLYSLETYEQERAAFRARVIEHKQTRRLLLGPHTALMFEDRLTIQYQIQEMLRIEKVFTARGIEEELEAYNPLIPDGDNFKATLMIEYPAEEERKLALVKLKGIEQRVQLLVGGCEPLCAIADEDMERENEEKTAAVHFLRFQLPPALRQALVQGASLGFAIDHPEYRHASNPVPEALRNSLLRDLT